MLNRFSKPATHASPLSSAAAWRGTRALTIALALALAALGCVQQLPHEGALGDAKDHDASRDDAAVIVGGIDWQEATTLPEGSAERANSRAVAHLSIPAHGTRCTGFLIAADVIMTNEHCIPNAAAAAGVRARFQYQEGGLVDDAGVDCSVFLGNDAGLDFALLQCAGRPGDTYGVVALEATTPAKNAGVYVIHQNCDYFTTPSCAPTKKYSPGSVTATTPEIGHNADTLGGSSGSPLFSRVSHGVIGLHHVGVGNDGAGRGTQNRAVPMTAIIPLLAQRYPGIVLGAQAPADPSTPAQSTHDGYEPNNLLADATAVQLPFSSVDAQLDGEDVDHFRFSAPGERVISLSFSHRTGDLDLYALNEAGEVLARSIGTTDVEQIALSTSDNVVIRVFGYRGAVGPYALDVR